MRIIWGFMAYVPIYTVGLLSAHEYSVCLKLKFIEHHRTSKTFKVQGSMRFIEVQLGFHPLVKRKPFHLPLFIAIIIHFLVMMVSVGQTRAIIVKIRESRDHLYSNELCTNRHLFLMTYFSATRI